MATSSDVVRAGVREIGGMTLLYPDPVDIGQQRDAYVGRWMTSMLGTVDLLTAYLGDRLGLYAALAERGPLTSTELADATATHERYVREWLEQQAVSGVLDVIDADLGADLRRYLLPDGHAEVLLDRDSLNYLAPMARMFVGFMAPLPRLLEAFRYGGGVGWAEMGRDAREGQSDAYRPIYLNLLGREWLPRIPDVHTRLRGQPAARVADFGCGAGWGGIGIARHYPTVRVDGFDVDRPSIEMARRNAYEYGVERRVQFHVRDATDPSLDGAYDLVTVFEALHDMAQPVEALATMRRLLAPGGCVLVVDEKVADQFDAPGDEVERLMYGFSVLCCLPAGLFESPSAGTGTMMRTSTLREYAAQAGFGRVEVLPIEHDFFRLYLLSV